MELLQTYKKMLQELGPQGWWPVTTKTSPEYHPGDYSYPKTEKQQWEICVGAILTQNTSWKNVGKALLSLSKSGITSLDDFLKMRESRLASMIRSSGYYNKKAIGLKELASFASRQGGIKPFLKDVSRNDLLKVKGVGPETADSILLYAGKRPYFVVDAYTRRLFNFPRKTGYDDIREEFESSLPRNRKIYNEFHALIVKRGKEL